jgi:hypothetical protein
MWESVVSLVHYCREAVHDMWNRSTHDSDVVLLSPVVMSCKIAQYQPVENWVSTARHTINQCLELKEANYTRNEATNSEKVLEAGHFVFSDDTFDADLNEPIASCLKSMQDTCGTRMKSTHWDSEDEDERKDAPWEVHTKQVAVTNTLALGGYKCLRPPSPWYSQWS